MRNVRESEEDCTHQGVRYGRLLTWACIRQQSVLVVVGAELLCRTRSPVYHTKLVTTKRNVFFGLCKIELLHLYTNLKKPFTITASENSARTILLVLLRDPKFLLICQLLCPENCSLLIHT